MFLKGEAAWAATLMMAFSNQAVSLSPGDRVADFRLLDERGKAHELYYLSDQKAVVIMTSGNGCDLARQYALALKDLRQRYGSKGVEFLLLDSNAADTPDAITEEADQFQFDIPVLVDDTQLIGESLGVTRTAEVFVIDPKTWKLAYRGPIDDRLGYGTAKAAATNQYLASALDAVLAGNPAKAAAHGSPGCLINLERTADEKKVSYSKTIAPLLIDKCVACHHPGGLGPWAMTKYDIVKNFSPMIREVIRVKRMPPWQADPHYGVFAEDRLELTAAQARAIVHWAEDGAPRGSGPDPLLKPRVYNDEWKLGAPDLIMELPAFDVPATGVVDYQYPVIQNPMKEDRWMRAVEIHAGAPEVVHHILIVTGNGGGMEGYSPGMPPWVLPKDSGVFFPQGANVTFSVHYNPNGRAVTDRTRVGFYFYKTPPKYPIRGIHMTAAPLSIPPRTKAYTKNIETTFDQDSIIYTVFFHAHFRGKAFKLSAIYPSGKRAVLVNVPNYEFRWQHSYTFKEPLSMPKGTKLSLDITWDNSVQNLGNPDPDKTVHWGEQSQDEMGICWVTLRRTNETMAAWYRLTGLAAAR
jgi:peroxiredoxin